MGRRTKKSTTDFMNKIVYLDYYNRLKMLALNCYKWEGLPDTIDERFLELTLFERGYSLYFNDSEIGNLSLPCVLTGKRDYNDIPTQRKGYANNGYTNFKSNKNSVIIYNNYLRIPTEQIIMLHAKKLYEIDRSLSVNVNAQKTPILILCSEQQKLTLENIYEQYEGNEPVIFGDKNLDLESIKSINTTAPYIVDKLQIARNQEWNNALTDLGIENSNQDKKERLVAGEVGVNYGNIEAQRNVFLMPRQKACEQINKMFGTNITVKFNSDLQTMVNVPFSDFGNLGGEELE